MILYVQGDLFQSPAQVLVNTVNTVGVMGKGIALEFKRYFPEMYREYRDLCERGQFGIGSLWLHKTPNKWVLNFPTKQHWRYPSRVEYIQAGLSKFVEIYPQLGIHSIAFPPLGCGNGQLDFETQVKPLMEESLRNLPIEAFIYPDRETEFIEHLHPRQMKKWLRSEPTNLPFAEVWEDLIRLLRERSSFTTVARGKPFTAQISKDETGIQVVAAGQHYHIPHDILMAFWQQLRTHGFSMRHTAPGINRQISYLIPVFTLLDYVKPVRVADRYDNLHGASVIGLQVLPSAFSQDPVPVPQLAQLSLFPIG